MFGSAKVALVVPAFQEAGRIGATLAGVPAFVDLVFVIDDGSRDGTLAEAEASALRDGRISVLRHAENRGVGAAISTGYAAALRTDTDLVVVIGADGQMDPREMESVVAAAASGRFGYVKGDRLAVHGAWRRFPVLRLIGVVVLTRATRLATGEHTLSDSQCGYTAITRTALERLDLDELYPRYGYPNDMLVRLSGAGVRIAQVPVTPLYGVGERSHLRIRDVVLPISRILLRATWRRAIAALRPARVVVPAPIAAH